MHKYNIDGNGKFISKTKYPDVINTAKGVVKRVAAVAGYASLGALCFAVTLFAAFSLKASRKNRADFVQSGGIVGSAGRTGGCKRGVLCDSAM